MVNFLYSVLKYIFSKLDTKFFIKLFIILLSIFINCELLSLDEGDDSDNNKNSESKGKEIDTSPISGDNPEEVTDEKLKKEQEMLEQRSKQSLTDRLAEMFDKMGDWESKMLDKEATEYRDTGELPEENLHSKMADFRREDESELQALREKLEKARIEETGESSSSQNKREFETSTDSDNDDSESNKPAKKK